MENFRNVELSRVVFGRPFHFLLGANGQGKTNCLEAISLVTALRSFRTSETRPLIRSGCKLARIRLVLQRERQVSGQDSVVISFDTRGKAVETNGKPETRFADFVGRFPTVVFSSDDSHLLRGVPALRRRFLDLTLSAVDREYFDALRGFHRALQERNLVLRSPGNPARLLDAYDAVMAPYAALLHERRSACLDALSPWAGEAYAIISGGSEELTLAPEAVELSSPQNYLDMLAADRERDVLNGVTRRGPHRDDIRLMLNGSDARQYASEGQQRGIVLALRFAQLRWLAEKTGEPPVILADDVLGELDPVRRKAFWHIVSDRFQVIASGTSLPDAEAAARQWVVHNVSGGKYGEVQC